MAVNKSGRKTYLKKKKIVRRVKDRRKLEAETSGFRHLQQSKTIHHIINLIAPVPCAIKCVFL